MHGETVKLIWVKFWRTGRNLTKSTSDLQNCLTLQLELWWSHHYERWLRLYSAGQHGVTGQKTAIFKSHGKIWSVS